MVTIAVTAEGTDEPRVAISPETAKKLVGLGAKVKVQSGAGTRSRFSDDSLRAQGAEIVPTAAEALRDADILFKVRRPSADEVRALKPGALVIAMLDPYDDRAGLEALAASNATCSAINLERLYGPIMSASATGLPSSVKGDSAR